MGQRCVHYTERDNGTRVLYAPNQCLQALISIWCIYYAVLVLKSIASYWYDYLIGFSTYGEKMELTAQTTILPKEFLWMAIPPKCLLPEHLLPKCLLPKFLLSQNVYSQNVHCSEMSTPIMSTSIMDKPCH